MQPPSLARASLPDAESLSVLVVALLAVDTGADGRAFPRAADGPRSATGRGIENV